MEITVKKKRELLIILPVLLLAFALFLGCWVPHGDDAPDTSNTSKNATSKSNGNTSFSVDEPSSGTKLTATFAGDYMYAGFGFTNSTPIYLDNGKVSAHDKQDFDPQLPDGSHEVCTDEYTLDGTVDSATGQMTATIKYHHEGDMMNPSGGVAYHVSKDYQGTLTANKVGEMAWEGTVTGTEDGRTLNWTVKISPQ